MSDISNAEREAIYPMQIAVAVVAIMFGLGAEWNAYTGNPDQAAGCIIVAMIFAAMTGWLARRNWDVVSQKRPASEPADPMISK